MTATSTASTTSAPSTATPVAGRRRGPSRALWAGLLAAAVALLTVAAVDRGGAESDTERIQRLSESFACPVCDGESVAESNAAVAATIRDFIAGEVASGASDREIRDALVRAYGVQVLLNPPAEGLAQLLWVLPVVLLVTGAVAVVAVVDRNRGRPPVTDDDRALVEEALAAWRAGRTLDPTAANEAAAASQPTAAGDEAVEGGVAAR